MELDFTKLASLGRPAAEIVRERVMGDCRCINLPWSPVGEWLTQKGYWVRTISQSILKCNEFERERPKFFAQNSPTTPEAIDQFAKQHGEDCDLIVLNDEIASLFMLALVKHVNEGAVFLIESPSAELLKGPVSQLVANGWRQLHLIDSDDKSSVFCYRDNNSFGL